MLAENPDVVIIATGDTPAQFTASIERDGNQLRCKITSGVEALFPAAVPAPQAAWMAVVPENANTLIPRDFRRSEARGLWDLLTGRSPAIVLPGRP